MLEFVQAFAEQRAELLAFAEAMRHQRVERGVEGGERRLAQLREFRFIVDDDAWPAQQFECVHVADRGVAAQFIDAGQQSIERLAIDARCRRGFMAEAQHGVHLAAAEARQRPFAQCAFDVAQRIRQPEAEFQVAVVDGLDLPVEQIVAGASERGHACDPWL